MTRAIKMLAMLATVVLMSSFTGQNPPAFIGTYGVSSSGPSQIVLTINADHTFYYQDLSVEGKEVIINGSWTQQGRKVVLKDNKASEAFHDLWSFVDNGQVAKSRKGLSFYRLCKIEG